MNPYVSPLELIGLAAEELGDLRRQVTFVGGSVVGLLLTDPEVRSLRATQDVDVTIELSSRFGFCEMEQFLRERGFQNALAGTNLQ